MDIQKTYQTLKEQHWVKTQEEFRSKWLGRTPRYYSMLLASNRKPSLAAVTILAYRIQTLALYTTIFFRWRLITHSHNDGQNS